MPFCSSTSETVGRDDPGVMRVGELALPLSSCSTWESWPCLSLGKYSRAGSEGVSVGELVPRAREQTWHAASGSTWRPSLGSDEDLTLVMLIMDRWHPDQLSYHSGLDPELIVILLPYLYYLGMVLKGRSC